MRRMGAIASNVVLPHEQCSARCSRVPEWKAYPTYSEHENITRSGI